MDNQLQVNALDLLNTNPFMSAISGTEPESNDNLYHYEPLPANMIRVLYLMPARNSHDPIRVLLLPSELSVLSSIDALSYERGDEFCNTPIFCGYKRLYVTDNLDYALRQIRKTIPLDGTGALLWVDAICVDQNNVQERNQQAKHMAQIYGNSVRVLVWLGAATLPDDRQAFDFAKRLWQKKEQDSRGVIWTQLTTRTKRVRDLQQLASKTWFQRVWTRQELSLAPKATILAGTRLEPIGIDWEQLHHAFVKCTMMKTPKDLADQGFRPDDVCSLHRSRVAKDHQSILNLFEKTQELETTDPRDRIFALASHPSAQSRPSKSKETSPLIITDYSKSLDEVYLETAKRFIETTRSLDILSYVRGSQAPTSLPTWAPIWHNKKNFNPLLNNKRTTFRACGLSCKRMASCNPRFHGDLLHMQLELRSVDVGTVDWHASLLPHVTLQSTISSSSIVKSSSSVMTIKQAWGFIKRGFIKKGFRPQAEQRHLQRFGDVITCGQLHPKYSQKEGQCNGRELYETEFAAYWHHLGGGEVEANWIQPHPTRKVLRYVSPLPFIDALEWACKGRRIFTTQSGYYGMGPAAMENGDQVKILEGGRVPLLLRQTDSGTYDVVGECYVSGIMKGELIVAETEAEHIIRLS